MTPSARLDLLFLASLLVVPVAACTASPVGTDPGGTGGAEESTGGAPGKGASGGSPGSGGRGGSSGSGGRGGSSGSGGKGEASGGATGGQPARDGGVTSRDVALPPGQGAPPATAGKPRPKVKDGNTIIHCSAVAQWEIDDMASYAANKANYEEIMDILDCGYPGIVARLGQAGLPLPVRVVIEKVVLRRRAGGGDVGYNDGDFEDAGGMDWIRGVAIGEVVNAVTGTVTDNWPSDWWVDGVWYFPGFVVVDVLKDVTDAKTATGWEVREKYPTYPIYKLFVELKTEKGWEFFQDFFAKVKADKMQWSQIGANPSAIQTNYVIPRT